MLHVITQLYDYMPQADAFRFHSLNTATDTDKSNTTMDNAHLNEFSFNISVNFRQFNLVKRMTSHYIYWTIILFIIRTKANEYNISHTGLHFIGFFLHHFRHINLFHIFPILNEDLQFCKEYNASGENYSDFMLIDSFKPMPPNVADTEDTVVHLRFYLRAPHDAHLLLSSKIDSSSLIHEVGVYYIVIWSNIKSGLFPFACHLKYLIRIQILVLDAEGTAYITTRQDAQSNSPKSIVYGKMIYSADITPLTLRITKSGNISVAITGQPSFVSYFDKDLLPIKYISFRFVKIT